ncbi:hypothetical protein FOA43_003301 [Brettanomyces nanus]|uniref:Protein BIG1 n=1 Tax=Eeniella nana TaxID=13502 RepID=A0A875S6H6_EENNA|nr:uncharacterized protein FOA43_003301 [Brettanomyces nanus]QPG75915.1 hypothetical protein FOA43_003301 [Brettanomyces nanus]
MLRGVGTSLASSNMKFGFFALRLVALQPLSISAGSSFENTAPLLVSSPLYSTDEYRYITRMKDAQKTVSQLSEKICGSSDDDDKLLYLRIQRLDEISNIQDLIAGLKSPTHPLAKLADHVIYNKKDQDDLLVSGSCSNGITHINSKGVSTEQWIDKLLNSDSRVNIIDFYSQDKSQLAESLKALALVYSPENLIVQGLPSFEKPDSVFKLASQKLSSFAIFGKRDDEEDEKEEEEDLEKLQQELDESFLEINQMMAEEGSSDEPVHAYEEDEEVDTNSKGKKKYVPPEGSLFDKYTFFSSGLWMAIIVSGFLFTIIAVAFSWLNSIQISYGAFEKPVNMSKKTQ